MSTERDEAIKKQNEEQESSFKLSEAHKKFNESPKAIEGANLKPDSIVVVAPMVGKYAKNEKGGDTLILRPESAVHKEMMYLGSNPRVVVAIGSVAKEQLNIDVLDYVVFPATSLSSDEFMYEGVLMWVFSIHDVTVAIKKENIDSFMHD